MILENEKMPTINMIVEEQRNLLPEITLTPSSGPVQYNSKTIFFDNKPDQGFLFKKHVRDAFEKFDLKELALLKYLLEAISNNEYIITSRTPEIDSQGKRCFWIRSKGTYGDLNYKVPYFLHLEIILESYLYVPMQLDFTEFYNEVFS